MRWKSLGLCQAIWLAQYRKISIWYRSEPMASTVPRKATSLKAFIASTLRQHLQHLLESAPRDITLSFYSGIDEQRVVLSDQPYSLQGSGLPVMELRIQTSQFYRPLTTYIKLTDFLTFALLEPYKENRTAWSDDAQLLIESLGGITTTSRIIRKGGVGSV